MSRSIPAAVGTAPVPNNVFDKAKPRRRDSVGEQMAKDEQNESPRGRKYSLSRRPPSERSDSSYSRPSSPEDRRRRERRRPRRRSYASSHHSRSPSPRRRSRSRNDRRSRDHDDFDPEKPWFKKKSIWATIASLASVASVAAVSMSTQATRQSAAATRQSAAATKQSAEATKTSARATRESAAASNRIARETIRSTNAVVNTAVASGHQDHHGRYQGPPPRQGRPRHRNFSRDGSGSTRISGGRGHNLLEYHPLATKALG